MALMSQCRHHVHLTSFSALTTILHSSKTEPSTRTWKAAQDRFIAHQTLITATFHIGYPEKVPDAVWPLGKNG